MVLLNKMNAKQKEMYDYAVNWVDDNDGWIEEIFSIEDNKIDFNYNDSCDYISRRIIARDEQGEFRVYAK